MQRLRDRRVVVTGASSGIGLARAAASAFGGIDAWVNNADGGLFGTVEGRAEARGGWGLPQRRRSRRAAAIGAAIVAGVTAALLSRASPGANAISEKSRTQMRGRRG